MRDDYTDHLEQFWMPLHMIRQDPILLWNPGKHPFVIEFLGLSLPYVLSLPHGKTRAKIARDHLHQFENHPRHHCRGIQISSNRLFSCFTSDKTVDRDKTDEHTNREVPTCGTMTIRSAK